MPDLFVTSVRCIVWVGERVVVCTTPGGLHIVPGGRREPNESYTATACREVREETGWLLDEDDLRLLGFFHYRMLDPQPADHPYPHPDLLQPVYTARAAHHSGNNPLDWVDTEGWEQEHRLLTRAEVAAAAIPATQLAFLDRSL